MMRRAIEEHAARAAGDVVEAAPQRLQFADAAPPPTDWCRPPPTGKRRKSPSKIQP
jgi:hypothetical protein